MSSTYTIQDSVTGPISVKALAIHPAGSGNVGVGQTVTDSSHGAATVILPAISGGSSSLPPPYSEDGTAAAAGDVLLACLFCLSGNSPITGPAGWTALTAVTGIGSYNVYQRCFWKVATAGDISGTTTFNLSSSTVYAAGLMASLTQGTIDATTPFYAEAETHTTSNQASLVGPDASMFAGSNVIEFVTHGNPSGSAESLLSSFTADQLSTGFLNRFRDGFGADPNGVGMLGFRYRTAAADQWHVGSIASGANWA